VFGESVLLIGYLDELGSWNTGRAVAINADGYTESNPQWSVTLMLKAGASFGYKYIEIGLDGSLT
jgi:hypothetical protein